MKNFIDTYQDLCEFDFLDGPYVVIEEPPMKYFTDKGFRTPWKRWQSYSWPGYEHQMMPPPFVYETGKNQTDMNYKQTEECI